MNSYDREYDEDLWRHIRNSKEAIRARALLVLYTAAVSTPFITAVAVAAALAGLEQHEVIGISCYNAMVTALFFFDTIRNAAHACFDEAQAEGLVEVSSKGIPVVTGSYPHRRLASISFAIGGRVPEA